MQYISNKCPECQAQFGSKEEVAEHFQEIKPAQTTVSLVTVGKRVFFFSPKDMKINRNFHSKIPFFGYSFLPLLFSSPAQSVLLSCSCPTAAVQQLINASTEAANRTSAPSVGAQPSSRCFRHTWTRPVCTLHAASDTGVISSRRYSNAHVSLVSLFSCKTSFSLCRCSSCLVVFGGLNSVKSHIQQAHCDMFHKCPSCPMAFKSTPSIQNHITAHHPTLTEGQTMYVYI